MTGSPTAHDGRSANGPPRGYVTASPPPAERLLLLLLCHPRQREFVVGDLDEEFAARLHEAADDPATRREARRWYRRMAWRSLLASWTAPPGEATERSAETERIRRREDVMELVWMDLRQAIRSLRRRPIFALAVVLTLGLAVGANTAMFSVVHAVLLRPLPYAEPDAIVRMYQGRLDDPDGRSSFSWPNLKDYREGSSAFESVAAYVESHYTLTGLERAQLVTGAEVTTDFFRVFRAVPSPGRPVLAEDTEYGAPPVVVISDDMWRGRFGADPDILGRSLELDGDGHQIVGVAPPGFDYPSGSKLWVGVQMEPEGCGAVRGCMTLSAVGRLTPGAGLVAARQEADVLAARIRAADPDHAVELAFDLQSLEEITVGPVRTGLLVLLGAVAAVLLVACVNIANLLYANWLGRQAEVAVRSAIGASRRRIVQLMLTEASLLAAVGGALGIGIAVWTLSGFQVLAAHSIPRIELVGLDWPVLLFTLVVVVDAVLIFGLAPALALSRRPLAELIKGSGPRLAGRRGSRGRAVLLAAQVAVSTVLLLGAGLLLRTLGEMGDVELGFEPDGVQTFTLGTPESGYPEPEDNMRLYGELLERLAALPGVESAAAAFGSPLSGINMSGSVIPRDRPPPPRDEIESARIRQVTPDYFDLMRIRLVRGRTFRPTEGVDDPPVVVISEATARRLWPGEDPLGKPLRLTASSGLSEPREGRRVVGIVEDVRSLALTSETGMEVYVPHAQSGGGYQTVLVRGTGGRVPDLPVLEDVVHRVDPDLALINPRTMRATVDRGLVTPRFYSGLLSAFAGLAVLLTAIGLYGVVAFQVSSRRREIGIRMAVGARSGEVVGHMTRRGLGPATFGVLAGFLGALALTRLLSGLLYNVRPHDPLTWLVVTAVVLCVVFAASTLPALRASRVAPADVLRVE